MNIPSVVIDIFLLFYIIKFLSLYERTYTRDEFYCNDSGRFYLSDMEVVKNE